MPVKHFFSELSRRPDRQVWLRRLIGAIALTAALTVELLAPLALSASARPQAQTSLPMTVIISEVAWMGTGASTTGDEWIELYNPGVTDITFTGNNWTLSSTDGSPTISLTGTILAGGYFLLERTDDTTVPGISADQIYSGALNDSGEMLQLMENTTLIDTANSNGGAWPAGDGVTRCSMERIETLQDADAAWLTATTITGTICGSPRAANSLPTSTPTITDTPATPPTVIPSDTPSNTPTIPPSDTPTITPSNTPSNTPTLIPTSSNTASPQPSLSVIINEIAWAGTAASSSDEWIELYNPGAASINLSGWKLATSDNSFSVTLTGVIPAQGYYLLERSDDQTISDIPADQTYSGSLSNDGKILRLTNSTNQIIDTANNNGGAWPAGNAATFCSMERRGPAIIDSDSAWISNTGLVKNGKDANGGEICGTPKNVNWAYFVTATPSPTASRTGTRTPTRTPTRTAVPLSSVVINEFLPHARSDWNRDGRVDYGDEFIEIINVSTQSVSLSGWWLDDQTGDSPTFALPAINLAPGAKLVYFAAETGILLSNRGDSVRLYKSNGSASDVYTYTSVPTPDQSWCRLPDGRSGWKTGCAPTPGKNNQLAETVFVGEQSLPAFCLRNNVPAALFPAECLPSGLEAWSRTWWDGALPGFQLWLNQQGESYLME